MLCFSSLLPQKYPTDWRAISSALRTARLPYAFLTGTRDVWLRDFMPVRTGEGRWISFRYAPAYLADARYLQTDFRRALAPKLDLAVDYSAVNLDGGNLVFSPSRNRVIVSDRIFAENPKKEKAALISELEKLLAANLTVIPSLKSDMTGHADGMVRFADENTLLVNAPQGKYGFEARLSALLRKRGFSVIAFPFFCRPQNSAAGCYLNYLETKKAVFLPTFGVPQDLCATEAARRVFRKAVIPVLLRELPASGGCLHCVSWEIDDKHAISRLQKMIRV